MFSKKTQKALNDAPKHDIDKISQVQQLEFDIRMLTKRIAQCPNDLKAGYELKLNRLQSELNALKNENTNHNH